MSGSGPWYRRFNPVRPSADVALVCATALVAVGLLRAPTAPPSGGPDPVPLDHTAHAASWLFAQSSGEVPALPLTPSSEDIWAGRLPLSSSASTPLTRELIAECLEVASDIDKKLGERLLQLHARKPEEFARHLQTSRRLVDLALLRQRDPALYQIKLFELRTDANVKRLALEYCQARKTGRTDELPKLMAELQKNVVFQVGSSLTARADYLCRLEELTRRLEKELEEAKGEFNETVARRVQHLIDCVPPVPPGGISPEAQRRDPVVPDE